MTPKQRANLAKWKTTNKALIQPKVPRTTGSWWQNAPSEGFTERAEASITRDTSVYLKKEQL